MDSTRCTLRMFKKRNGFIAVVLFAVVFIITAVYIDVTNNNLLGLNPLFINVTTDEVAATTLVTTATTLVTTATTIRITENPLNGLCGNTSLTVLSAFFDIGDHFKGGPSNTRKITVYKEWSSALAYIHTPFVFYTDSQDFAAYFTLLRARLHPSLTHIVMIKRDQLWSFGLRDAIAALYARKDYPKHHPNTVVPEYTCAQHSKYACLHHLITQRPDIPATDTYAWLDFGYFRDLHDNKEYCMTLPKNFDRNKVTFYQITLPDFNQPASAIFRNNVFWVGGGMFVATRDTMIKFCNEYRRSVEYWLFKRNLSDTDQQNIYASFTTEGQREVNFTVDLQVDPGPRGWFELGFSCLRKFQNEASAPSPASDTQTKTT